MKNYTRIFFLATFFMSTLACTVKNSRPISRAGNFNKFQYSDFFGILDSTIKKKYQFIQFQHNNFQFQTKNAPNFNKFYQDLKRMIVYKDRKINIYHLGGSHIQADIYPHKMRTYLQQYWPGLTGERGWVFPFDFYKTNTPQDFAFISPNKWIVHKGTSDTVTEYGLAGQMVECGDSLIRIKFNYEKTKVKPGFDKVRIYHQRGQMNYSISFGKDSSAVVRSILDTALGYTETYFERELVKFQVQFKRFVPFIKDTLKLYGFQLSNKKPGITYNSIGVNGASLPTYIRSGYFEDQLRESPPDFFIFSVGTNDANVPIGTFSDSRYERRLDSLVRLVLKVNPNCAILFTMPNDAYFKKKFLNRNLPGMRTAIFKIAKKYNAPVWDFYGIMGELGSSKTWSRHHLMRKDLVHFTQKGYEFKGDLFFEAFMKWFEQMKNREDKLLRVNE